MGTTGRLARAWLIGTGTIYALGAVDFLARPWAATASLSQMGGDKIETEPAGFYNSLASAYMATIAAISLSAAKDPEGRKTLIPPLLVAKAVSSGVMLARYLDTKKRGYAAGAALDASLFAVTAAFYRSLD